VVIGTLTARFVMPLLAEFPAPPGKQFSIGPLDLRAYGLMIALGVIAGVWLLGRQFEAAGIGTRDDAGSVSMWGVVAGVLGARAYHVITDWSRFSHDLGSIPKIWEGGLGIPGGLLAGIAVGLWQARRRGLGVGAVATFAAPSIALAQSIGRWGNWFNQELFGKPSTLPWALQVDPQYVPVEYPAATTFHPTFLYESLWNLALCGLLLWIQRRYRLAPGRLMAVYLIGYGAGRFWIEGLRIDLSHHVGGLRWNQWVALAAVLGGAAWLAATRGRRWEPVGAGPSPLDGGDDRLGDAPEPDRALDEFLDEVGGPAGDPGHSEQRHGGTGASDEVQRPEPEVDVGQRSDPPAGDAQHVVDDVDPAARPGE
jgi:prolipoprotein diacylglyceryl transferase